MNPTELASLMIPLAALLPGLYFFWLHLTKDKRWAKKKMHTMTGDEYQKTDAGVLAIDDENWVVYFYRR